MQLKCLRIVMLKQLLIKDYALIDHLTILFGPGLNIMTGETGAGKSIIIGALGLLLGERAKTDIIRQGQSVAIVEGTFELPANIDLQDFQEYFENHKDLLLRREIHSSGRSRCFINDSPVSNTVLSGLGDLLIDLHGQHEHQALLKTDRHLDYLDNFGVDSSLLSQVKDTYKAYQSVSKELSSLREKETLLNEKRDLLEFQVHEIETIKPEPGEEAELEAEEKILRNSEKICQSASQIAETLYDSENSVAEILARVEKTLSALTNVDKPFEGWFKSCENARLAVEDIVKQFQAYAAKIEFNPQHLEEIRERLGHFSHLKKKYGGEMDQIFEFYEKIKKELNQIETMDSEIQNLEADLKQSVLTLTDEVRKLSENRMAVARELEKKVIAALEELGLKKGKFEIHISRKENDNSPIAIDKQSFSVNSKGIDQVEFHISLNPGQDCKPLAQVASGGEISRIMLALKTVLAESDNVPIMVFDEIDTGISGRIARVVGNKLKEVSERHQIICITHLPQIASMGNNHLSVRKHVEENQSRTTVKAIKDQERVEEIAQLLGGEQVTESVMQSARELLSDE